MLGFFQLQIIYLQCIYQSLMNCDHYFFFAYIYMFCPQEEDDYLYILTFFLNCDIYFFRHISAICCTENSC